MSINDLVKECFETAKSKGWQELDRRPLEHHALMASEISEATEEVRADNPPVYQHQITYQREKFIVPKGDLRWNDRSDKKPEGEAVELIDCVIRIMTYFGEKEWDFEKVLRMKMNYNKTRSFRHGGKKL